MAPENNASVASGPALNVFVSILTFLPSALEKNSLLTPTIGVAWVRFGKYPSRRVTGSSLAADLSPPHAARPATTVARATTAASDRFTITLNPTIPISLLGILG